MFGAILRFLVTAAAVPLCAQYLPGVHMTDWTQAVMIGAILGVFYIILRPLLRLLLKVINWLTLGLLYVVVDAWLVWTAAGMLGGAVTLDNYWWAIAVAFVVNVARTLVGALTGKLRD
ncbi:MAG: phage holin family protein [Eubacteriales bacterium]|nr:phage holin family protein [Eubacteriales bacterium]